ncbi:MAG: hypothetical protein ABIK89_21365 [Planctomycetota bacterium]
MTMRQRGAWVVAVLWATSGGLAVAQDLGGGMVDPGIDTPGEPFSYFRNPTDVIGSLYAPVASEVTPEGYIYTGFGELMFFVGNPAEPVRGTIRPDTPPMSFEKAVQRYKQEYKRRYDEFLRTGVRPS